MTHYRNTVAELKALQITTNRNQERKNKWSYLIIMIELTAIYVTLA